MGEEGGGFPHFDLVDASRAKKEASPRKKHAQQSEKMLLFYWLLDKRDYLIGWPLAQLVFSHCTSHSIVLVKIFLG